MDQQWTPPQLVTAALGVLGFLLSCYNYLLVQRRKDKDERQRRLWDTRFRLGQQKQEAMGLLTAAQVAAIRKKQALQDVFQEARQAGRNDLADRLQKPLENAEARVSNVTSGLQDLLSLTLPMSASMEDLQKLEEIYGQKILVGLKMGQAADEPESEAVNKIVKIVKDALGKT